MKAAFSRLVVYRIILSFSMTGITGLAVAAPIAPGTLLELNERGELLSRIQAEITRDDVRKQFAARGVSPEEVDARVAAMSTEELQLLSAELDELPAGGGVLAVIGVVFVVLLILELVGVTNIFTAV